MDKIKWTEHTCPPVPEEYPRYGRSCCLLWDISDDKSKVPKELRRHKWLPTHIIFSSADGKDSLVFNPHKGDYVPASTLVWIKKYDPILKKVARDVYGH